MSMRISTGGEFPPSFTSHQEMTELRAEGVRDLDLADVPQAETAAINKPSSVQPEHKLSPAMRRLLIAGIVLGSLLALAAGAAGCFLTLSLFIPAVAGSAAFGAFTLGCWSIGVLIGELALLCLSDPVTALGAIFVGGLAATAFAFPFILGVSGLAGCLPGVFLVAYCADRLRAEQQVSQNRASVRRS
ncbi:MAG: hypothetical protein ACOYKZ_01155 [Chlamydiia bacterium]